MTSCNNRPLTAALSPVANGRWNKREKVAVYCCLNLIGLSVAMFNIVCAYGDINRKKLTVREHFRHNRTPNGFEAVIVANIVLIVGVLFGRQVLLAIWICAYSCILLICCVQSIAEDEFPWTPGVSRSSTIWIMDTFKMPEEKRPAVAISITLCCLMLIFVVFMIKGLESYRKRQERICRLGMYGRHCNNQDRLGHLRNLLLQAIHDRDPLDYTLGGDPQQSVTSEDRPPAYSDLEDGTSNINTSSTMPPPFEDAIKEGGKGCTDEVDIKKECKNVKNDAITV